MISSKILYVGALTATANTPLYTVPSSTTAAICCLNVTNVGSTTRTFNIALQLAGAGSFYRYVKDYSLVAGASVKIVTAPGEIALNAGDVLSGDASAATDLEVIITGREAS